jgi:hypothetical protein
LTNREKERKAIGGSPRNVVKKKGKKKRGQSNFLRKKFGQTEKKKNIQAVGN